MRSGPVDPYEGLDESQWRGVTEELVAGYPLTGDEIVEVVLDAWNRILTTKIAGEVEVGTEARPTPQMYGNFLHVVIASTLAGRYPGVWRKEAARGEKDFVYLPDDFYSTELKSSSHPTSVFGNRSYASPGATGASKSGFYLTVNFQKYANVPDGQAPQVTKIALGWLNHSDWRAQAAESGQAASVIPAARANKFVVLA